jgi:glucose/mannose-6-phosphate isomerase
VFGAHYVRMQKIILDFPKQFKTGLKAAERVEIKGRFDKVLICGMGGSALPGDLLKMWIEAYGISLPLCVWRNYSLPRSANKRSLVLCLSYSGNTEEVLSSFKEARENNFPLVAITSGGKLAELCGKYGVPLAVIPGGLQPRMTLGYQFSALMKVLVNCGLIKDGLENISALEKKLKPRSLKKRGEILAKKIKGKIPIIYASHSGKELARMWKIKFNENSKTPSFSNYFPELNHNEMVGFSGEKKNKNFHVFILRDSADHPRILKRMKLTAEILKERGIGVDIIEIRGKDVLFKIFSNLLLSDWVSYYLALERKIDPVPVKIVEEFKKKIK